MLKYNVEHGQEYKPFEIIASGIPYNPTGDLISREALKEVVKDMRNANPSYGHTCDVVDRAELLDEIDNAPTVSDRYDEGFRDGYAQCINDKEERKENNRLFQKGDKEE